MQSLLPLASEIGAQLVSRGQSLAISESSSGGLISSALLATPGASKFYRGGAIVYTAGAFKGLLGLSRDDLDGARSSSEPYARLLAGTIRDRVRSDWGLCETGAAGPDGNGYGDPAGHTCIGIVGPAGDQVSITSDTLRTGVSVREENMRHFARFALECLQTALAEAPL